jgi:3-hydroxyisobutyrate dehydrogenase-like beta-hydroxyacid dehydrogenase
MLGEQGIITAVASGAIIVDHTTTSAKLARQLAIKIQRTGNQFVDAPVSGGQQGAENGQLTVMCGGQAESFAKVKPIIECYAKSVQLMGDSGSGQLCKMVNQICIAGLLQGLAEGLNFAERAGLDAHQVIDVISQGAAQSWQMENRYKTMLAGDYEHGFAVQWMRKDLAFALQEARSNGAQLPVTELVDQYYEQIEGMGGGRYDTSSLLFRLKHPDQA